MALNMIRVIYPKHMLDFRNLFEDECKNSEFAFKKLIKSINDSLWFHVLYAILVILAGLWSNDPIVIDITFQLFKSLIVQFASIYALKLTKSSRLATFVVLITMAIMLKAFKFGFGTMIFMLFNLNFLLLLAGMSGLILGVIVNCISFYFNNHLRYGQICVQNSILGFFGNAGVYLLIFIVHNKSFQSSKNTYACEISSRIGHELKTPLFGIIGGLTSMDTTNLSEDNKKLISIMEACSNNLLNQIENMSEIFKSKIDGRKIEDVIECTSFIDDLIKIITPLALQKNHHIYSNVSESCPKYIITDSIRLKHILSNLLFNSIKYTPPNGVIKLDIDINKDENINEMIFTIEDNGIGIDNSKLHEIFESFQRIEQSTCNIYGGIGLGLSIAKSLAEEIGATICVKSEGINEGSTFIVKLPFKIPNEKSIEIYSYHEEEYDSKEIEEEIGGDKTKHILIVDDDTMSQYVLNRMIVKYNPNYIVTTCSDGGEAIEKLRAEKNKYSLIIMDMEMPNMNGEETTKRIKRMNIDIPIIILTGHSVDYQERMMDKLDVEIISKPLTLQQLKYTLKKYSL